MNNQIQCKDCGFEDGHGLTCKFYKPEPLKKPKQVNFTCHFHPTESFHETGCSHDVWSKEQLQSALETAKLSWQIAIDTLIAEKLKSFEEGYDTAKSTNAETPMGSSQWKNHGQKYKYWDYFKQEAYEQGKRDTIIEVRKQIEKEYVKFDSTEIMAQRFKDFNDGLAVALERRGLQLINEE